MLQKKLWALAELAVLVRALQKKGIKIVFKSGVFDMLHPGHVRAIAKSKQAGDILVVAVHGDEMTRKRKGPPKPIYTQEERAEVLSHVSEIDYLLYVQTQDELYAAIKKISPDILMVSETSNQGADNTPKTMQRKFGHLLEVVVLPEQWGQHVTDIIERIRKS